MASMTFQINDGTASSVNPAVWVTITENADGSLAFSVTQSGGIIGDLRGLFFDLADESLLASLVVTAPSPDIRLGNDTIRDLGDGANMNGLLGSDKGYDVGIEIGSSGIGKDDIRSYAFTLSSRDRDLSLADFAQVDFAARLTSVGTLGGSRAESSKLLEVTSTALDLIDHDAVVVENNSSGGSLLSGISLPGTTSLTGWSGGSLGTPIVLESGDDPIATLTLQQDGQYQLDASQADRLSAGEEIVFNFDYSARNQSESTSWSDDSASFSVRVIGTNDGPQAEDDQGGCVDEDQILTGNVTTNDSDIDRLDTHTWALVDGSFDGEGLLEMAADGSWRFDAQGAYDHLNAGEHVTLSFSYTMTDNHGATDTAQVSFCVEGVGSTLPPPPPPPPPPAKDFFPTWSQDISHFTLVFDQTQGDTKPSGGDGYYTVKIDVPGSFNDDLDVSLAGILAALRQKNANVTADSPLIGVVIKGGVQVTSYYAYGSSDSNGTGADPMPAGIGFSLPGDHRGEQSPSAIDVAYALADLGLIGISPTV
jgi:VCBS repeat-containing protein